MLLKKKILSTVLSELETLNEQVKAIEPHQEVTEMIETKKETDHSGMDSQAATTQKAVVKAGHTAVKVENATANKATTTKKADNTVTKATVLLTTGVETNALVAGLGILLIGTTFVFGAYRKEN